MSPYRFWPRQWGKRRALDLVADQVAELEQRSVKPAAGDPLLAYIYQGMNDRLASGGTVPRVVPFEWSADVPEYIAAKGWIAPSEVIYD